MSGPLSTGADLQTTGPCACCRRPGVPADRLVDFVGAFRSHPAAFAYVCQECRLHVDLTIDPARAVHRPCPVSGHYTP